MTATTTMNLTDDVRSILEDAVISADGRGLAITDKLERKRYAMAQRAILAMGGRWDRKMQTHRFDEPVAEVIADAVATGSVTDLRKLWQVYESPPEVARAVVTAAIRAAAPVAAIAGLRMDKVQVLEPSAGTGNLVQEAQHWFHRLPDVFEILPKNRERLLARFPGITIRGEDFLAAEPPHVAVDGELYDLVVANPPFSRGQDIAHVARMVSWVRPGGVVASVMSPAWTYRETRAHRAFRDYVGALGSENATWKPLPAGSFEIAGTGVTTGLLVMVRPPLIQRMPDLTPALAPWAAST